MSSMGFWFDVDVRPNQMEWTSRVPMNSFGKSVCKDRAAPPIWGTHPNGRLQTAQVNTCRLRLSLSLSDPADDTNISFIIVVNGWEISWNDWVVWPRASSILDRLMSGKQKPMRISVICLVRRRHGHGRLCENKAHTQHAISNKRGADLGKILFFPFVLTTIKWI